MFKLVVLCAIFAAATAKPGALVVAPISPYSTLLTPGETTIIRQDSSVIHPAPLIQEAPWAYTHLIKKRSPQFPLTYAVPATYNAPLIHSTQILPAPVAAVPAVHLIKKRSVVPAIYAPSTYAATAPVLASTYAATAPVFSHTPLISAPLISQPLWSHLIKKRSAGLLNTFIAPTSYSHASRFDLQAPLSPISYASPAIAYSSPLAYSSALPVSHLY